MGTQEEKLMLFESMLDFRGYEQIPSTKRGCKGQVEARVEQACRNCTNIKNRQTKARDASLSAIEQIIADNNLLTHKLLAVKLRNMHVERNLTGLIANQLMSKYQRPVLLLSETNPGRWEGSGRGYDKSKLTDLREFLNDSELVEYAQGQGVALKSLFCVSQRSFQIKWLTGNTQHVMVVSIPWEASNSKGSKNLYRLFRVRLEVGVLLISTHVLGNEAC